MPAAEVAVTEVPVGDDEPPKRLSALRPAAPDLLVLGYALGMLVLWMPGLDQGYTVLRNVLLLTGLGPGLVQIAVLARRGDRTARWALALVVWLLVSTLASDAPLTTFVGGYGTDLGFLAQAGFIAAWGLGRSLGHAGRVLLPPVLALGLGVSVAVGLLQAALQPTGELAVLEGRVNGLTPNSLYLGGLVLGGVVALVRILAQVRRPWVVLAALVLLGAAANLTGSRATLIGVLLGTVLAAVASRSALPEAARSARATAKRAVLSLVALALGVAASVLYVDDGSTSSRLRGAEHGGGVGTRLSMWRAGFDAFFDRPLFGWGPGRFRAATGFRVTPEFVRSEGPDRLFFHAHNLVVEALTTTGAVGLVLLMGFAWQLARRSRGPLAWFAGGVAATWMLTPTSISTVPLVLLALGAAHLVPARSTVNPLVGPEHGSAVVPDGRTFLARPAAALAVVLALVGLAAGMVALRADRLIRSGVENAEVGSVLDAERLLPPDGVLADLESQVWAAESDANPSPAYRRAVVDAARRATRLDPTRSTYWVRLGYAEYEFGSGTKAHRLAAAERAFRTALVHDPYSVAALQGLVRVAAISGERAAMRRWDARVCELIVCAPR